MRPVFLYQETSMAAEFIEKLEKEIKTLEYELHNELPKEIQTARELGDLKENAEYAAAKERQDLVRSKLGLLQKRLADLSMIDFTKIARDAIGLGSTVKVFDVNNGVEIKYRLVTSEESDVPNGKISTTSPIGRGMMGKKVGDIAEIKTPNGEKEFEILELKTIHDQPGS
jgi:transcription elongation factor GreA